MITWDDFDKIWASTSPLTPYTFGESNYKEGWNFIGSTPPARQMWDFLQKQNDEKFKYLRDNFGTPNIVTQASQMTDTDKVYVYLGSEAGWNNGHWYYYDEGTSSWADGGVYNSVAFVTDTTLSIAGQPADAKATGDALALKSDLAGCTFTGNVGINADLSVTGDATIGTDLSVTGVSTLTGNVSAGADVTVVGDVSSANLTTSADATIGGDLSVTGASTLAGNITTSGDVSADNISATTNATVGGNLSVTGTSTLTGDINAGADIVAVGDISADNLTTSADATVGGDLTVTGDSTLADATVNDLVVNNDLSVAGDSSLTNLSVSGTTALAGTSTAPTPSADDNSTKIATTEYVQTEIKPIEVNADIVNKRVTNIEKLLEGNLYDYQTDTDSKYTKTVPQGAMPYASLEQIGGKTVVWNQLFEPRSEPITSDGITFTNTNGLITTSGVATADGWVQVGIFYQNDNSAVGDKLLFAMTPSGTADTFYMNVANPYWTIVYDNLLFTKTANTTAQAIRFYYKNGTDMNGKQFAFMGTNLTKMYGSGNEPTSVEEFQQTFPAVWYAFNEGSLLSAGVTEVVSVGKNLWNLGNRTLGDAGDSTNTTPRTWNENEFYYEFTRNNYYYKNEGTFTPTTNGFEFTPNGNYRGVLVPFKVNAGEKYTFSCVYGGSGFEVGYTYYDGNGNYISFDSPSNAGTSPSFKSSCTIPANAKWLTVVLIGNNNVKFTVTNPQLEVGTTATAYAPYKAPISYPIPAEIQALEGYGWSVQLYINNVYSGDVYNQIDFENKKYIQNVGKVTLNGSESWTWDTNNALAYTIIPNGFIVNNVTQHNTYVMSSNPSITSTSWGRRSMYTYTMGMYYGQTRLFCKSENFASANDVKTYFTNNPTDVNYVLQNPVETDISAYLTDDNLISVESGGTLTFPNANGDDYRIDVPSQETFMVDLQEAI